MSDYDILIAAGHSAAKAAEIALDAERGDSTAKRWVEIARGNGFKPEPKEIVIALTEKQFQMLSELVKFHLDCDADMEDLPYSYEDLVELQKVHFSAD